MADSKTSTPQSLAAEPARRFRWRSLFRYRLQTLLVLMTLIAVWLGWWSHAARKQREAVAALEQVGVIVQYDYHKADLERPRYWPMWLVETLGVDYFADVRALDFIGKQNTNPKLEHLQGLTELKELYLLGTGVTDAGLEHLQGLTALEVLSLGYTQITDAGLEHLKGMTNLLWLDLRRTQVTDAGVAQLQEALPNCEILH